MTAAFGLTYPLLLGAIALATAGAPLAVVITVSFLAVLGEALFLSQSP